MPQQKPVDIKVSCHIGENVLSVLEFSFKIEYVEEIGKGKALEIVETKIQNAAEMMIQSLRQNRADEGLKRAAELKETAADRSN